MLIIKNLTLSGQFDKQVQLEHLYNMGTLWYLFYLML